MAALPKIARFAWTGAKKLLGGAKWRYTSGTGKLAGTMQADEIAIGRVMKGHFDEALFNLGVWNKNGKVLIKKADLDNLTLSLDKGMHYANPKVAPIAQGMRKLLDDAWTQIQEAGGTAKTSGWEVKGDILKKIESWNPIGKQETYFPHYLKREYAQAFIRDGDRAFRHASLQTKNVDLFADKVKLDETSISYLDNFVSNRMAKMPGDVDAFNERTVEALSMLIGRGESPGKAIAILRDRGLGQITAPFSLLKRGRKLNLMSDAYESNPVVALDTYFRNHSRQVAHLQVWGSKNEKWGEMLNTLRRDGTEDEIKAFERLTEYIDGTAEFKYTNDTWRKFAKGYSEIEVMTKIGLGTAFIPNLTQLFISTIPKVGYLKGMKSVFQAFTKAGQAEARGTGINGTRYLAMNMMAGMPDDYVSTKGLGWLMSHHPGMDLFQRINKYNNVVSAIAGKHHLKAMHKKALQGSDDAIRALKKYGIDHRQPLDQITLEKGMFRFATDMQLQKDILADPLWMNDPRFRLMALFKRFGLRQTAMVYENFISDAIITPMKKGQLPNVKPMLMLLAHGVAGGYFVNWAKNSIREDVFGAPPYSSENTSMLKEGAFAFAQSGAFGMVGDILGRMDNFTAHEIIEGVADNAFFSIMPIALSEVTGIPGNRAYPGLLELSRDLAVDWAKYGLDEGSLRQLPRWMKKVSPMGAYPAARMRAETKKEKERNKAIVKYFRGRY